MADRLFTCTMYAYDKLPCNMYCYAQFTNALNIAISKGKQKYIYIVLIEMAIFLSFISQ